MTIIVGSALALPASGGCGGDTGEPLVEPLLRARQAAEGAEDVADTAAREHWRLVGVLVVDGRAELAPVGGEINDLGGFDDVVVLVVPEVDRRSRLEGADLLPEVR